MGFLAFPQAELLSLKSSRTANLAGTVVEARLEKGQGPVATVIVKQGSLRVGAPIVVGCQWGRVRALRAPDGDMVQEVGPGRPVLVAGLRGVPEAGDEVRGILLLPPTSLILFVLPCLAPM